MNATTSKRSFSKQVAKTRDLNGLHFKHFNFQELKYLMLTLKSLNLFIAETL
jgi:hypothetical protein